MKRQGDLLIIGVQEIPVTAIRKKDRVLAEGEVTGHLHELDSGEVYESEGILYFKVDSESQTTLNHPEHKPVSFETGVYKVIRQREYEPKGPRQVAD